MDNKAELLPCPFCGAEMELHSSKKVVLWGGKDIWFITNKKDNRCDFNCPTFKANGGVWYSEKEAVEGWNRRSLSKKRRTKNE